METSTITEPGRMAPTISRVTRCGAAAPGTSTATERHARVATANGHLSLAVRAIDEGGGVTRLVYALMNYDYDAQFSSFTIPASGTVASSIEVFTAADQTWTVTSGPSSMRFDAPVGEGLDWGRMLTITFTVSDGFEVGQVTIESLEEGGTESVTALVHIGDLDRIFADSFD